MSYYFKLLSLGVLICSSNTLVVAGPIFNVAPLGLSAPGQLVDSPLFSSNNAAPNIFFEVDDSGSMDFDILTTKHWQACAYRSGNDLCGFLVDDGYYYGPFNNDNNVNTIFFSQFVFLMDTNDDAYQVFENCNGSNIIGNLEICSNAIQQYDWRVKSSSVNVIYYLPGTTYQPWVFGDGSTMTNATFSAARSNPQVGSTGYTLTRNLQGFVYHVWNDTHGFTGTRPTSGTINKNVGANGIVDWWDNHQRFTVNANTIVIDNITYTGAGGVTETVSSTNTLSGSGVHSELGGKTIAEVQQNIANWYQYARRRSFVTKSAIAKVITDNPSYRYGLNFINNTSFPYQGGTSSFVEMPSGIGTTSHNTKLIAGLFDLDWLPVGTPLRAGLDRVGKYYDNTDGRSPDPIIEQCQHNFTILFTDGYWNGTAPAGIADEDGDGYTATVADIAKEYYSRDLSTMPNNVLGSTFDPATYQHMVTYTVAFGLEGLLVDTDNDGWPGTSPGLSESADWGDPFTADSPEKIDDMWHAAFNSKGAFVSAESPQALSQALTDAFSSISDRLGSGGSVAFNTTTLSGNSSAFLALFNSANNEWSGDILSYELDPTTGDVAATPNWSASDVLNARANPNNTRKVFTYNDVTGNGVRFRWGRLSATQKADLRKNPDNTNSDNNKARKRLQYLRGSRVNEEGRGGTYTFRERHNLLGDIIHSDPVFIGAPQLFWPSVSPFPATASNTYEDFKTGATKNREPIVYVGANDGMLHGFKASDGEEVLAYIPNSVFSSTSATRGLHYLTDPGYTHRYYTDMPLTVSDVYIDKGSGDAWRTVLIGGGRKGSRGIFALDITDPTQYIDDNAHAESLVLWEFDSLDDADLGFTFSKPTIAMMNNGKWAAIFGNGYNSTGNGKASLFIVFLEEGLDG
ncbi:MAG: hypothetical protein KAH20_05185, partial [Methylococcales bacterium]|nr:hypothetical protein [Methylococcales bacterium]